QQPGAVGAWAAGGVLTAEQAPHRPGTAPALGLRAGADRLAIGSQTGSPWEERTMSFSTLLHWLGRGTPRGPGRRARQRSRRQPTTRRPAFRPRLDVLEDRTLPSVFVVTNADDSGAGSLRAAITAANTNPGADLIAFAPTAYGTIALTSGQLSIT